MKIHVLPGDALAQSFKETTIEGEIVICRECLIDGEVKAENLEDFWKMRAAFINGAFGEAEEKYFDEVVSEFKKLSNLSSDTEVNLWFEYELFCQTNMWFCLSLLQKSESAIYRVMPSVQSEENIWKGFGNLGAEDLEKCFAERVRFSDADISLGAELWNAYQNSDYAKLKQLSETESDCFPYLKEVVRAEIEKSVRPKEILQEIIKDGASDFKEIFPKFSQNAGVYGFGDTQVKRILQQI